MIVGHCRFSGVGFSDTGRLASDIERAKIELWNPMRMAIRFWLFEQVLLPSLDTQIDQGFVVSLLISDDLPQKYLRSTCGYCARKKDTSHSCDNKKRY